jgi:hypothetical protein
LRDQEKRFIIFPGVVFNGDMGVVDKLDIDDIFKLSKLIGEISEFPVPD